MVYRVVCRMIKWGFNEVLYLLYLPLDRNAQWIFSTPLDWLNKSPPRGHVVTGEKGPFLDGLHDILLKNLFE